MTLKEVQALLALFKQESIDYDHIGGRQHYLLWKTLYRSEFRESLDWRTTLLLVIRKNQVFVVNK